LGFVLSAAAMLYALIACVAERVRILMRARSRAALPPVRCSGWVPTVTLLKPLCGIEPETYECLRSFCQQEYPSFQLIFGVADPADPAVELVRRLQAEYPQLDIQLVIERKLHGASRKVSNLINMLPRASNEVLVLSDSDVRVASDYLRQVVAPLESTSVGIVTCAYHALSRNGVWNLLAAQFINEWFIPSVQVAALGGSRSFAFGATIALRRQVLARVGGLGNIADQLADDYRLGELTRDLGLRTVLSDFEVEIAVTEHSFGALIAHELRWLRTIRALRPFAYSFFFVTFGVPVALLGAALARGEAATLAMLAITCCARLALHLSKRSAGREFLQWLLVPVRECLSLALWAGAFATRRVRWRGDTYRIERDGSVLHT
jgi:ceramide glucosyltransferase